MTIDSALEVFITGAVSGFGLGCIVGVLAYGIRSALRAFDLRP